LPSTQGRIEGLKNIEKVDSIYAGTGVIVDAAFRVKEVEYSFEETDPETMAARADYLNARAAWSAAIAEGQSTSIIAARKNVMEQKYDTYIAVIEQTLEDAGAM
jgi:hypothetical protein